MNLRLSSEGFLVDHVLGWAAGLGDADVAGAEDPGSDRADRASRGAEPDGRTAGRGEMGVSRSGSLWFPYSGR